jgi:hypothetical protein
MSSDLVGPKEDGFIISLSGLWNSLFLLPCGCVSFGEAHRMNTLLLGI